MDAVHDSVVRDGNSWFLVSRGRRLLRTWDPATEKFTYTRAGLNYYSRRRIEYVVHIPVIVDGVRDNGTTYQLETTVPLNSLGRGPFILPQTMENDNEAIKRAALALFDDLGEMYSFSREVYRYDEGGRWSIETLETLPGERAPRTRVRMRQFMRGIGVPADSDVLHPELLHPLAFEERTENDCVLRQVAAVLGIDPFDLELDFDAFAPRWREVGVTAEQLVELCQFWDRSVFVLSGKRLLHKWAATGRARALAFSIVGNHCMCYTTAQPFSQMTPSNEDLPVRAALPYVGKEAKESVAWIAWRGLQFALENPGHYWAHDIDHVRAEFGQTRRFPPATMKGQREVSRLTYTCCALDPVKGGKIVVKHRPVEGKDIEDAFEILRTEHGLDVDYDCESLAMATLKAFKSLLRLKRTHLTKAQQEALRQAQNDLCAMCGGVVEPDERQFDHVFPLRDLTDGQEPTFQLLCFGCHQLKTAEEPRCNRDPLLSCFGAGPYRAYVESPKATQAQFQINVPHPGRKLVEIDTVRCRRNALYHSGGVPVFGPTDVIVPAAGQVFDFQYVDAGNAPRGKESKLFNLPYVGPGWYCAAAVRFMLDHGQVDLGDIKLGLDASAHVLDLRPALDALEGAYNRVNDVLAKRGINAMIGIFGCGERATYRSRIEEGWAENTSAHYRRAHQWNGVFATELVWEKRIVDNCSYRPLYDIAVQTEHVRLAQAAYVLRKLGTCPRSFVSAKTDALILESSKKVDEAVEHLTFLSFGRLHGLRATYEPVVGALRRSGGKTLLQTRQPEIQSSERVFRSGPGKALGFDSPPPEWRRPLLPHAVRAFNEVSPEAAEDLLLAGESVFIRGIAGTGKTTLAKRLIERLEGKNVAVLAKTHCAVQNIDGLETLDRFVHKEINLGRCCYEVVVVDEISMVNCALFGELAKLALFGKQLLVLGDYNQFPPIADQWKGSPLKQATSELALVDLCPHRVTLTQNVRSDPPLFQAYASLVEQGRLAQASLAQCLADLRPLFPRRPGHARWNLCLSHLRRVKINDMLNRVEAEDHPEAVLVAGREAMRLWPGLLVVGRGQGGPLKNGCFFEVKAVDQQHVVVGTPDGEASVTHAMASRNLRLTYALTYASCQGLTLKGKVRLWDANNRYFTKTHLFVALSRATKAELVEIW